MYQDSLKYVKEFKINNSMEQSPSWEANSHSANQEMIHLLWDLNASLIQGP